MVVWFNFVQWKTTEAISLVFTTLGMIFFISKPKCVIQVLISLFAYIMNTEINLALLPGPLSL